MTRYKLDEKTGMIWMLPGESTEEEALSVLTEALCINTARLAHSVGVPRDKIKDCKFPSLSSVEENLKNVDLYLHPKTQGVSMQ